MPGKEIINLHGNGANALKTPLQFYHSPSAKTLLNHPVIAVHL
jgi:hypothetical protein